MYGDTVYVRPTLTDGPSDVVSSSDYPLQGDPTQAQQQAEDDFYNASFNTSGMSENDYQDLNADVGSEKQTIDDIIYGTGADVHLSQFIQSHPGASKEEILRFMAEHNDEWAEKYLDYMLEKQSLDEQNSYTASREDTAYQRLVADLKAAGLNPAMMYGSSASTSASGSLGYLKQAEGATSRSVNSFTKLKNLLYAIMAYELNRKLDTVDTIFSSGKKFTGMLKDLAGISAMFS